MNLNPGLSGAVTAVPLATVPKSTDTESDSVGLNWDTECYRGIKPIAEGHPKPRIGSDDVTPNITSPLV